MAKTCLCAFAFASRCLTPFACTLAGRTSLRIETMLGTVRFLHGKDRSVRCGDQPPIWNDTPGLGKRGIAGSARQEAARAQQKWAKGCEGNTGTFVSDQWRGFESGGWIWGIAGANGDNGSGEQRGREVPDREAFLFLVGSGAQARYYWGESAEQSHAENQESSRAGVQDGSTVGEEGRLSIWSDVSALAVTPGASPGNGGNGTCHSAGGVQDAQVQSGI